MVRFTNVTYTAMVQGRSDGASGDRHRQSADYIAALTAREI